MGKMALKSNDMVLKLLRFALVGSIVTVLYIAIYVGAKQFFFTHLSVLLAYFLATISGFFLHKIFSFQSKHSYAKSVPKYCVTQLVVLLALIFLGVQ